MYKKNLIFSGVQPTGKLHIGNYLGVFKNFLNLQNKYKCIFMIADLHSLTASFTPSEKRKQIIETAIDFLALGLDPSKCILFIQSHVKEHTELTWIFNCLAPISEMQRMTQFKDKIKKDSSNINMGLFDYPALMASDVLLYKANSVPVGKDQVQHLELTRFFARTFNNRFGKVFTEPKPLFTKIPNLNSLTNPKNKMSKSHAPKSYIALNDEPDIIHKKLAKAVTGNLNSPGTQNLMVLLKYFAPKEYKEFSKMKKISFRDMKQILGNEISKYFFKYREKRKELLSKPDEVISIFQEGALKARIIAEKTIREVKKNIGLI